MSAFCPQCETDLDQGTGICPACRWSPYAPPPVAAPDPETRMSITERYRGTSWDAQMATYGGSRSHGVSRGRIFVVLGMLVMAAIYGLVMVQMGAL